MCFMLGARLQRDALCFSLSMYTFALDLPRALFYFLLAAMDFTNTALSHGTSKPPFTKPELDTLMRERYLLWTQCVESKAGQEPQNPFLYGRYE